MFCPMCGKTIPDDVQFCPHCGTDLTPYRSVDAVTPPTPSPAPAWPPEPTPSPSVPPNKRHTHTILIAIAAAIAVVAVVLGMRYGGSLFSTGSDEVGLEVSVDAPHLDDESSRIPVQIDGTDTDGNAVSRQDWVAYEDTVLWLPHGAYDVTVLGSPIASDGTIYYFEGATIHVTINETVTVGQTFQMPADQSLQLMPIDDADVTDEQISDAIEWVNKDPDLGSTTGEDPEDAAKELSDAARDRHDKAVQEQKEADEQAERQRQEEEAERQAEEARQEAERQAEEARQAELDQAIADAEAQGYTVVPGTIHADMNALEILQARGKDDVIQYADVEYLTGKYPTVFFADTPIQFEDVLTHRPASISLVGLSDDFAQYSGQHVYLGVRTPLANDDVSMEWVGFYFQDYLLVAVG